MAVPVSQHMYPHNYGGYRQPAHHAQHGLPPSHSRSRGHSPPPVHGYALGGGGGGGGGAWWWWWCISNCVATICGGGCECIMWADS
mmetsp:Transcript_8224/g.21209  ORF Transcript_8224/g.21209 Transcript_8224/m.21209 type:complete len:86 (+) Transcript_8224:1534-1791(+)